MDLTTPVGPFQIGVYYKSKILKLKEFLEVNWSKPSLKAEPPLKLDAISKLDSSR